MNTRELRMSEHLTFLLPPGLLSRIGRQVEQRSVSRSELIRACLYHSLEKMEQAQSWEALELLQRGRMLDSRSGYAEPRSGNVA